MQKLIGNILIAFYTIELFLLLILSFLNIMTVRFFDWLFGTDLYGIQTRPNAIEAELDIWLSFRQVYKKYFPDDVEELNRINQDIESIQEELE